MEEIDSIVIFVETNWLRSMNKVLQALVILLQCLIPCLGGSFLLTKITTD
jgi:hypothetical protein